MKQALIYDMTIKGTITDLFRAGILPMKVIMYRDIFYDVDLLQKQGVQKTVAKQQVADKYNISIQMVYKAIKWFQS